MKRANIVAAAAAATLLLAGCGSNDSSSSSSSASSTTAATTASSGSSDMTSSVMITPTGTTISAGGDETELDEQSSAWFTTLCEGLTGVADLQNKPSSTPAEAGQLLTEAGTQMTATGQALAAAPPPTFEGGDEVAAQVVKALQDLGPSFEALGQKASTIQEGDTAAAQQFATEFQQELAPLAQLNKVDVTPETQQAIAKIPACTPIFGASSGGGTTTTS